MTQLFTQIQMKWMLAITDLCMALNNEKNPHEIVCGLVGAYGANTTEL